jgi:thiamine-monophosphate kinase
VRISELGEFGLIERIRRALPHPSAEVVVGIGDDVAVMKISGPEYLLATCDVQVENVHFQRRAITPYQLGCRIAAINMSDIAAMGGAPQWALVSLALPPELETDFVDALYEGMQEQLGRNGAAIVGGNLSRMEEAIVIDLCLLGKVLPENLLLRSGACRGDLIMVTGWLGDSRAGLELIRRPDWLVSEECRRQVEARHLTPLPRLREGQELGRSGWVHAMADISDGMLGDIGHICRASGVGAEIWLGNLPISAAAREVAHAAGKDAAMWALTGGEDYELLFTVPSECAAEVQRFLKEETGTLCHVVGQVMAEGEGVQIRSENGKRMELAEGSAGWDHFSAVKETVNGEV